MAKKRTAITFLIPTYKGRELLEKNLPSVMAQMKTGDELLVSEDASDDLTNLRYFRKKYNVQLIPEASRNGQLYRARITYRGIPVTISFFQRYCNGRFARNVNEAVELIENNYFLLLNNDVKLTAGVRDALLAAIQADTKIFAVTAREIDVNNQRLESGRNQIWWEKGRFWHARDERVHEYGPTAWACGGSSLFDIDKWHALGGFDTRFYPAYWEDIDISWQAQKRGWKVQYCPDAVVEHVHETTNIDVFGEEKIQAMSWKNGTKFAAKNAVGKQKWQFWWYYWYWQLRQFPALRWWWVVILGALIIRLAFLTVPHGLTVDETAIAYNGMAVWTTRRDEWLNFLPVTFRSFGDYKAPLAIYLSGLVTTILGMDIWTIRLPFALAGIVSVWLIMKLVDALLEDKTRRHLLYAALAGGLMTMSWWHFHYSHLGFENNFALVFQLAAIYLLYRFLRSEVNREGIVWSQKWWSGELFTAALCLVASLYSYHSSKITVPCMILCTLLLAGKKLWLRRKTLLAPLIVSVILLVPLIQDSFCDVAAERPFTFLAWSQSVNGKPRWQGGFCGDGQLTTQGRGLTRANSSFLFDPDLSVSEKWDHFWSNYLAYWRLDYLIGGQTISSQIYGGEYAPNVRHGDATFGILWWGELILLVILLVTVVTYRDWRRQYGSVAGLGLLMLTLGLLPAAITDQVPHSNQALPAIAGMVILETLGLIAWRRWWRVRAIYYPSAVMMLLVIIGIEWGVAQKHYLEIFAPAQRLELTAHEKSLENPGKTQLKRSVSFLYAVNLLDAFADVPSKIKQLDQIIYAGELEQPYIYALLAEQMSPEQYRYGKLSEKHMLVDKLTVTHLQKDNAMIIYSPLSIDDSLRQIISERCVESKHFYFGGMNNLSWCITKEAPKPVIETDNEED